MADAVPGADQSEDALAAAAAAAVEATTPAGREASSFRERGGGGGPRKARMSEVGRNGRLVLPAASKGPTKADLIRMEMEGGSPQPVLPPRTPTGRTAAGGGARGAVGPSGEDGGGGGGRGMARARSAGRNARGGAQRGAPSPALSTSSRAWRPVGGSRRSRVTHAGGAGGGKGGVARRLQVVVGTPLGGMGPATGRLSEWEGEAGPWSQTPQDPHRRTPESAQHGGPGQRGLSRDDSSAGQGRAHSPFELPFPNRCVCWVGRWAGEWAGGRVRARGAEVAPAPVCWVHVPSLRSSA